MVYWSVVGEGAEVCGTFSNTKWPHEAINRLEAAFGLSWELIWCGDRADHSRVGTVIVPHDDDDGSLVMYYRVG